MTAAERGQDAAYLVGLLEGVSDYWERLRRRVELVIKGEASEDDIRQAVRLQALMVVDLNHLTLAVTRFARIEQGGQGNPPSE